MFDGCKAAVPALVCGLLLCVCMHACMLACFVHVHYAAFELLDKGLCCVFCVCAESNVV